MTFQELNDKYQAFKNKYIGKYTDYDGAYGAQCWDLAQRYFVEYLGVPEYVLSGSGLVSNMLDRDRHELNQYFDEISLTEMHPGDIVIWAWGHIALFDRYDGANWYFSQNPGPCQVINIRQDGQHAFRLKGVYQPEPPKVEEPKQEVVIDNTKVKELEEEISILKNQKLVLEERIIELVDRLNTLTENEPKQVFKCAKTGMYKIKLKENEILYIG